MSKGGRVGRKMNQSGQINPAHAQVWSHAVAVNYRPIPAKVPRKPKLMHLIFLANDAPLTLPYWLERWITPTLFYISSTSHSRLIRTMTRPHFLRSKISPVTPLLYSYSVCELFERRIVPCVRVCELHNSVMKINGECAIKMWWAFCVDLLFLQ